MNSKKEHIKVSFWFYLGLCFLLALFFFELGIRYFVEPYSEIPLHRLRSDTSYLFDLNPEHPDINEDGFRKTNSKDDSKELFKKIVFLGDSVTFGLFVSPEESYAAVIEKKIIEESKQWEVINAGINGYTLYNELSFHEERIQKLHPDIVVLALCLNDIVNPVIHWQEPKLFEKTPLEAYPLGKVEQEEARLWVEKKNSFSNRLFSQSAIFRFLNHVNMLARKKKSHQVEINGKKWPVHIADESDRSIQQLANRDSLEWQWLEKNIIKLKDEVEASGAKFVLVFLPLAYQVDRAYPIQLNDVYDAFCQEHKMSCFDPLQNFLSTANPKELYMGAHRHHLRDIWHFSAFGHQKMAEFFYQFLKENKFI